jgi:2-polyprenyl-3-methyl-5-hydroxy-6-metoxy-1,4-benzoquinol methylase
MRDIQARVRARQKYCLDTANDDVPDLLHASVPILDRLHAILSELQDCRRSLDTLPPRPPTIRGTIGSAVVQLVQRVLFWQYTQARVFQAAVTGAVDQAIAAFDAVFRALHRLSERTEQLIGAVQELQKAATQEAQELRAVTARLEADNTRLAAEVRSLHERLSSLDRYTVQTRRELVLQEQRLSFTLDNVRRLQTVPELEDRSGAPVEVNSMAGLYMAFEEAFRGSQEEITERVGKYLPDLQQAGLQPDADIVIDIGCGRGEWLRVLAQAGYRARGCDSNEIMAGECQERGLDVVHKEAVEFLGGIPENSAGAVTAFHVVEHLSIESMLALIDSCLRVLRPGGILILETPNPLNVLVSCHSFYLDPTHVKPLPMQLLQFCVEARGFSNVRLKALHPYPEATRLRETSECAERFNEYFYGPQDYAIVATKP